MRVESRVVDSQVLTLARIKSIAWDCTKTHRWCVLNDSIDGLTRGRIIRIGSKHITVMIGCGVKRVTSDKIKQVW
jgi:hypothetical protein